MRNYSITLPRFLQKIADNEKDTIRAEVANEALDYDYPKKFFLDLFKTGCVSGMVGRLVYYKDTHKFFDKYYDEIEKLRFEDIEEEQAVYITGDLKNAFAWYAFMKTAKKIFDEWQQEKSSLKSFFLSGLCQPPL